MALIKPISELTSDDLALFPLWEFATDIEIEHDETYVRPVDSPVVPVEADCVVYHVACDVRTASGRLLSGHLSVCNGEVEDGPPLVVNDLGECFALEEPPHRRNRAAYTALLGESYAAVFPVHWHLRLRLDGEPGFRDGVFAPEGNAA